MSQLLRKTGLFLTLAVISCYQVLADQALCRKIVINEVMQSSFGGELDMLKEYPDGWIELYNPGTQTVNLNKYRIGKKNKFSKCFELPSMNIAPGGHVVIYCDKEDTLVFSHYLLQEVHTDFRLTTDKESAVYLFDDNKELVDTFALPALFLPGVAYGRLSDGSDSIGPELKVTRGKANEGGLGKAVLPMPVLSINDNIMAKPGGTMEAMISVKLIGKSSRMSDGNALPDSAVCHYTLDGSDPTPDSPILGKTGSSALVIKSKTTLRTAYFCDGYVTPPAESHYYLYHGRDIKLPVVLLSVNNDDLNSKEYGIFENQAKNVEQARDPNSKNDWRRPAYFHYFLKGGGTPYISQRCEIRVGGGYTRMNDQKSVVVYANDRFVTPDNFEYNFWSKTRKNITAVPSLLLRLGGNDWGYSYMRDAVSQIVFANYTDMDWQACQPAIYYINDEYQGLINIRERANEDNVWSHYDSLSDITLIEISQSAPRGELKSGDYSLYDDFVSFYSKPGQPIEEYEKRMDLKEYTNFMICEIFFGNTDFPANNNVLWRPNGEDGKWRWIIKDVDRAFNIWSSCPPDGEYLKWILREKNNITFDEEHNSELNTLMFRNMIKTVPEYRDMFVDHFLVYLGDFLTSNNINYWIDFFANQMRPEIKYFKSGNGSWENELKTMKQWGANRINAMYKQLTDYFSLGNMASVQVNNLVYNQEAQYFKIKVNGVSLSEAKMKGKLPTGREYVFEGSHTGNRYEIIGWNMSETVNGTTVSWTEMSPTVRYTPKNNVTAFTANAIRGTSGVEDHSSDYVEVMATTYYNMQGQASNEPFQGLNIVKYQLENGQTYSEKVMFK